jgi:antitoxin ParD1/3/4
MERTSRNWLETKISSCYQFTITIDKGSLAMPSSYAIGKHFEGFIKKQIESGRYSSASEVVRDALRMMEEREELREIEIKHLRQQIQEGRESGPGIPADKVFDRLEAKYRKLTSEP